MKTTCRVLVVEDDQIWQDAYQHVLTQEGFDVICAMDGASAVTAIEREDLDVVLLDIGLPDVDGLDLLVRIREDLRQSVPVIMVTGADQVDDRVAGLARGANDYLVKPVAFPELVARVDAQVRQVSAFEDQVGSMVDLRRAAATQLAAIEHAHGLDAARSVLTGSVAGLEGVAGAAYATDDDVVATAGIIPAIGPDQVARLAQATVDGPTTVSRAVVDLAGPGRIAVVPVRVHDREDGIVLAFLDPTTGVDPRAVLSIAADLAVMATPLIEGVQDRAAAADGELARYRSLIDHAEFVTHFQPIIDLRIGVAVGYEALTRFDSGERPDLVFAGADGVGLRIELEQAAALEAAAAATRLPSGAYVSINLSPDTALDTAFLRTLTSGPRPVLIELTEHDAVADYSALDDALETIRHLADVAVDDAGAGYAGLHHIRALRPDVVKLDRSLVRGLPTDPVGQAMIAGMVHFARTIGCRVVAEGIETAAELAAVTQLGVTHGQGYLLGRPAAHPDFRVTVA